MACDIGTMITVDRATNLLRRAFLLKARWHNFEHPANPKPPRQRHIDLTREFLLSEPVFNSQSTELSRSIIWTLDRLAGEESVLEACQFALAQVKESISREANAYEHPHFKTHYEHSLFQHIAARVRFLGSQDNNRAFMNPAVRSLFEDFRYDKTARDKKTEADTPFKVNRSLRMDNNRIDYLKSVKLFLDDFLETLDGYDYDETNSYIELYTIHKAVFDVLEPIELELSRLSDAEVVAIDHPTVADTTNKPKNP